MAKAFVGAHISGFFAPIYYYEDTQKTGSIGGGINLEDGVTTSVDAKEGDGKIEIFFNKEKMDLEIIKEAAYLILPREYYDIKVKFESEFELEEGFGISGALVLGFLMAINKELKLDHNYIDLVKFAHHIEVTNKTGLGDIIGQYHGGMTIREVAGTFGIDSCTKINIDEFYKVLWCSFGKISTKELLNNREKINLVHKEGIKALNNLIKNKTPHNFMKVSKQFAKNTKLTNERIKAIDESVDIDVSQVMLGNTAFALVREEEIEKNLAKLNKFGDFKISDISTGGAKIV